VHHNWSNRADKELTVGHSFKAGMLNYAFVLPFICAILVQSKKKMDQHSGKENKELEDKKMDTKTKEMIAQWEV